MGSVAVRPRYRKWRAAFAALLVFTFMGGSVLWRYWATVKAYVEHDYEVIRFACGDEPIQRVLAGGKFGPGSRVEDLIAAHPSEFVFRGERYTLVEYRPTIRSFTRATVVAKDGRLASVVLYRQGVEPVHLFDTFGKDDYPAYFADIVAVAVKHREARVAVLGFGGSIEPWELPP